MTISRKIFIRWTRQPGISRKAPNDSITEAFDNSILSKVWFETRGTLFLSSDW